MSWQDFLDDPEMASGDILHMDFLHERRLTTVAAYWSSPGTRPPDEEGVRELLKHLRELSDRREEAPRRLATSTLAVLCTTPRGARLWRMHPEFTEWAESVVDGVQSTTHDLSIASMHLVLSLVGLTTTGAVSPDGISFYPEDEAGKEGGPQVDHGCKHAHTRMHTHA